MAFLKNEKISGLFTYPLPEQTHANLLGISAIVLSTVFQFFLTPVVKTYLGADGLGLWHLIFQTYVYLQLLDIGLSNSIVREIAYTGSKKGSAGNDVFSTAGYMLIGVGLAFFIVGTLSGFAVPKFINFSPALGKDYTRSIMILSCWGFFRYFFDLPRLSLRGMNKLVLFNQLTVIDACGRPFAGILLLIATKSIIGIIAGYILIELVIRAIAYQKVKIEKKGRFDKQCFRRLIKFGSGASIARLASLLVFYNASFIIGWRLDVVSIAIYQCTIALPLLIYKFAIVPFTNLLPSLVQYFRDGGKALMRNKGIRPHILIICSAIVCYLIVISANEIFVRYWVGKELYGGFAFTMVFSVFCVVSIVRHNGYIMLQAQGRLKAIAIAHLVEIPANLILSIYLVDEIGLSGVALACLVAHLPVLMISHLPFNRLRFPRYSSGYR